MKKQQSGHVYEQAGSWCCRWRETARTPEGGTKRVQRFKLLREVTAEDRRNKDRATNKLRIPKDVQTEADKYTGAANENPDVSALLTIGEFVPNYLKEKKESLRPGTYANYEQYWQQYLQPRIADKVLRDFKRKDAFLLWQKIAKATSLSRQTMNHIRFFMSGVFKAALNRGLMEGENPAEADLPTNLRGRGETEAYTIEEVNRMLELFVGQPKAQAVIALDFASALRKSEISALEWSHYERADTGAVIHVRQSNVKGLISKPKTESSADDVYIDESACRYIDRYRKSLCNESTRFMFGHRSSDPSKPDSPLNMDSFVRWTILPVLETCATCSKTKMMHTDADHEFQRNESVPEWKGFHAFRRGNATYLAKQSTGDGLHAASITLRHADEGVTGDHYVKVSKQQKRVLKAQKVVQIDQQRKQAAATIGAGLKVVN